MMQRLIGTAKSAGMPIGHTSIWVPNKMYLPMHQKHGGSQCKQIASFMPTMLPTR
jgi:hypothetical protein